MNQNYLCKFYVRLAYLLTVTEAMDVALVIYTYHAKAYGPGEGTGGLHTSQAGVMCKTFGQGKEVTV